MNLKRDQQSHLFLVRFCSEEVGDSKELRGRVQHVLSGEAGTFYDWPAPIDLLVEMAETEGIEGIEGIEARAPGTGQAKPRDRSLSDRSHISP